ncbi:hypothetical protein B0H14DRAFT_2618693 [Mycena olivaceomarginata]|nr:hypothetical protein B0H14DRAFT_2618693 [Mycena olivaceomarginata]
MANVMCLIYLCEWREVGQAAVEYLCPNSAVKDQKHHAWGSFWQGQHLLFEEAEEVNVFVGCQEFYLHVPDAELLSKHVEVYWEVFDPCNEGKIKTKNKIGWLEQLMRNSHITEVVKRLLSLTDKGGCVDLVPPSSLGAREAARSLPDPNPAPMQRGSQNFGNGRRAPSPKAHAASASQRQNAVYTTRAAPHKVVALANAEKQPPNPRTEKDRISPTHRKGSSQSFPPQQQHTGRTPFGPVPNPSDSSHNQLRNDRGRDNSTSPTPSSRRPGSHARTAYPLSVGATDDEEEPAHAGLINEDVEMYSQDGGRDDGDEGGPNPDTDRSRGEPDPQRPSAPPQRDAQDTQNVQNAPDDSAQPPRPPFAFGDKNPGAQLMSSPPTEMPTEARFLACQPTHKAENPHRKARPYEQTLSGPEDVGRTSPSKEMTERRAWLRRTLSETPEDWTLVAFHLGGTQMFEAWGAENLAKAVSNVLTRARLADEDDIELFVLAAANNKRSPKNPYGHPCVMAMRVPNPTVQARLCDIGTFHARGT